MRFLLKAKRLGWVSVFTLAVGCAITVAGGRLVMAPNLMGGPTLGVPASLLLPAVATSLVGHFILAETSHEEAVAVRPVRLISVSLLALMGIVLTLGQILSSGGDTSNVGVVVRNYCGYLGMLLICRRFLGARPAALVPVGYAAIVSVLGQSDSTGIWAWCLDETGGEKSMLVALLATGAGLTLGFPRIAAVNRVPELD